MTENNHIVILAATRGALRRALRRTHRIPAGLRLRLHVRRKRFIGRTATGSDDLGYRLHPARRMRPSAESERRLRERARRPCEQGASTTRLRQYVTRWWRRLMGGPAGLVCGEGGVERYCARVLSRLSAGGPGTHPTAAGR